MRTQSTDDLIAEAVRVVRPGGIYSGTEVELIVQADDLVEARGRPRSPAGACI
jgi:hypothetical protein